MKTSVKLALSGVNVTAFYSNEAPDLEITIGSTGQLALTRLGPIG